MKHTVSVLAMIVLLGALVAQHATAQDYDPLMPQSSVTPGDETPTPAVDRLSEEDEPAVAVPDEVDDQADGAIVPLPPAPPQTDADKP